MGVEGSWWPVAATPPGCRGETALPRDASVPARDGRGTRGFGRRCRVSCRRRFLDGGARRCLRTGAVVKTDYAAAVLVARRGATCSIRRGTRGGEARPSVRTCRSKKTLWCLPFLVDAFNSVMFLPIRSRLLLFFLSRNNGGRCPMFLFSISVHIDFIV